MGTKVLERRLGHQTWPTQWSLSEAREAWADFRQAEGLRRDTGRDLLTAPDGNVKLAKNVAPTYSLALSPAATSGFNVCQASTPECRKHCVAFSGKGGMARVQKVRVARTRFLAARPQAFLTMLVDELDRAVAKHGQVKVRLNAFSDLAWEAIAPWLFERYAETVTFYDYTKRWDRTELPTNYLLTYSVSEKTSLDAVEEALGEGRNVAAVVGAKRGEAIHSVTLLRDGSRSIGFPSIDGDKSDDRSIDPRGVVVALRPKGTMRQGSSMVRA